MSSKESHDGTVMIDKNKSVEILLSKEPTVTDWQRFRNTTVTSKEHTIHLHVNWTLH